jgi:hypothetical protein
MAEARSDPSLLSELTYGALPDKWPAPEDLARKGWYASVKSLHLPTIDPAASAWTGKAVSRIPPVDLAELKRRMSLASAGRSLAPAV